MAPITCTGRGPRLVCATIMFGDGIERCLCKKGNTARKLFIACCASLALKGFFLRFLSGYAVYTQVQNILHSSVTKGSILKSSASWNKPWYSIIAMKLVLKKSHLARSIHSAVDRAWPIWSACNPPVCEWVTQKVANDAKPGHKASRAGTQVLISQEGLKLSLWLGDLKFGFQSHTRWPCGESGRLVWQTNWLTASWFGFETLIYWLGRPCAW